MRFTPNSRNDAKIATLLFLGLESPNHYKLESILQAQGHRVLHGVPGQSYIADAAFCDGDDERYRSVLAGIHARLPLIVVTQNPTEEKWLDALEAGAADYCSAPFEPIQVRWILDAVRKQVSVPIAAAA
jgi:DNA-binding response OmpR family regulator